MPRRPRRIRRQVAYALRMEARRQQQEAERLGGAGAQVRKTKFKIYELTSITEIEAQERRGGDDVRHRP